MSDPDPLRSPASSDLSSSIVQVLKSGALDLVELAASTHEIK